MTSTAPVREPPAVGVNITLIVQLTLSASGVVMQTKERKIGVKRARQSGCEVPNANQRRSVSLLLRDFVEGKNLVVARRQDSLDPTTVIPEAAIAVIWVSYIKFDVA